jgi:hypothetical protein
MDSLLLVGAIELRIVYSSFSVDVDVGAMLIVVLDMAVVIGVRRSRGGKTKDNRPATSSESDDDAAGPGSAGK